MDVTTFRGYLDKALVTVLRRFSDGEWSVSFVVHPTDVSLVRVKDIPFAVEKDTLATGKRATPPVLRFVSPQGSLFFIFDPSLFFFTTTGFLYKTPTYAVRWECLRGNQGQ